MITITLMGVDSYITGKFAETATPKIAKIYKVKEEEILFIVRECEIFFKNVEQSSYQGILEISAPKSLAKVQDEVAEYLLQAFNKFVVHISIVFHYFDDQNYYQKISTKYPRFLDDDDENEDSEEMGEAKLDDEELYIGNAFEGFSRKYDEQFGSEEEDECDCDEGDCEDDDHCHCENCTCDDEDDEDIDN